MRKSPTVAPKYCKKCGKLYTPTGNSQSYCKECRIIAKRETRLRYEKKKYPNRKPKQKVTDVCCICGGEFSSFIDGKPYCNKHYLRMYNNGTTELIKRESKNKFIVNNNTVTGITTDGKSFLFDLSDFDKIKKYTWCFSKTGYLVANINYKVVKLHRYLLNPPQGVVIDHINGNTADNRRCNLRECTVKDNARNLALCKNNKTGITGVKQVKNGKYVASIMVDRKHIGLGTFDTIDEAFIARRDAELKYYGEFSPLASRNSTVIQSFSE